MGRGGPGDACGTPSPIWPSWSTRQALNALRAGARRREDYVGPWLPEPLLLDERDASADVVLAESVSMAMLVVLETLSPDERAVFVLREVFGFDYDEIAVAVGKSTAAVRQMAHRAREHVQARRKRFEPVDPATVRCEITEQFFAAAATGDIERTDDDAGAGRGVDGGQRRQGQRGPPAGGRRGEGGHGWSSGLIRLAQRSRTCGSSRPIYNSAPALVLYLGDHFEGVIIDRDHRRQDHQLLRHAQPGEAGHGGRSRATRHDQPLSAFCHDHAASSHVRHRQAGDARRAAAAPSAVPPRRAARSPRRRRGWACLRPPR